MEKAAKEAVGEVTCRGGSECDSGGEINGMGAMLASFVKSASLSIRGHAEGHWNVVVLASAPS